MKNFICSKEKADQVEMCVLCGAETPYKFYEHIDMRYGYVEGCGQLCEKCYDMGTNREQLLVPASLIKTISNDSELGAKVRKLYWDSR